MAKIGHQAVGDIERGGRQTDETWSKGNPRVRQPVAIDQQSALTLGERLTRAPKHGEPRTRIAHRARDEDDIAFASALPANGFASLNRSERSNGNCQGT